jgi:hypothetical protein
MRVNLLAMLILVGVGCGDDAASTPTDSPPKDPDAAVPPPDGTVDTLACTPAGAPGPVVVDGPSGAANLQVVVLVHDQAGAVIDRSAMLGPDATTTVDVPSCGMVSIFHEDPEDKGPGEIITWSNVQPGDHLVHVERRSAVQERIVNVQLQALAGATSYRIVLACPNGGTAIAFNPQPGTVEMSPNCPPGATSVTVLALAKTATGASTALATVPLAAAGATSVTLPAYVTAPTVTATVAGAGVFDGGAAFQTQTLGPGNVALPVDFSSITISGDLAFPATPTVAGAGVLAVSINTAKEGTDLRRVVAAMPATLALTVDDLLPIPRTTVDSAARPTATWGVDRLLPADADVAALELDYNADEEGVFRWTILTPPVPGSVRFPELPADLVPAGTATVRSSFLVAATSLAGYADARNKLSEAFGAPPPPGNDFRTSSSRP